MLGLNLNLGERIQGWNSQEQDYYQISNNMLRILESKIINSVKLQEQYQLKQYSSAKLNCMRPATVRVRPTTSRNQRVQLIQSHPTIDICHFQREDQLKQKSTRNPSDHHELVQLKYRNKSVGNNIKKTRSRNKENIGDKQFHDIMEKQKQKHKKGEQLQMKKQSLIFRNYNSLKDKKVFNKFHEMEIKMRKNRNLHNKTALSQKQKINIVIESFRKGNDTGNNLEVVGDQNMFQLGLEKPNQNNYIKLSRKQKLLIRQKQGKKKDPDVFTDAHLTNLQSQ